MWLLLFVALLNVTDLLLIGQMATVHLSVMAALLLVRSFCARNPLYFIFFSFISLYVLPAKLFFLTDYIFLLIIRHFLIIRQAIQL